MKRYTQHILIMCSMIIILTSCELFGLDYQYDYKNDKSPIENFYMDINCYKFIEERSTSTMSLMYNAINRAGLKEFYETDGKTFLLLEDNKFAEWIKSNRCTSLEEIPVETIQSFLYSYTIKGTYSVYELTTAPIDVETFNSEKMIRLQIEPRTAGSSQDITSLRAGWTPGPGEKYQKTSFYTTNLRPTNGVAHLLQDLLKVGR